VTSGSKASGIKLFATFSSKRCWLIDRLVENKLFESLHLSIIIIIIREVSEVQLAYLRTF
jgi:hypothetical protein